ncbi:MerR family transcriptional regulator [Nocardia sp. NPDC059228]|uniref:MerR family transcriptional regulator n=2 Tax=Actinomycetes TaxID=1760 RepID=UPI00368DA516
MDPQQQASQQQVGHLPGAERAVYAISVAAELSGLGVQTLRLYEQHGLITPHRSSGGTRRYSGADLARLARITALTGQGVNLAGIARILDLEDANTVLRESNTALTAERDQLRDQH